MRGSPRAADICESVRRVKFGNPVIQRDTTASSFPILRARSRWDMCFSLRVLSIRAIIPADICTSAMISGETFSTFDLNHSCLLFIS